MSSASATRALVASLGLIALVASVRCADVTRGLGEPCIRNEDCLSGVCAGQQCVAQPTVFDASRPPTADAGADAQTDGAATDGAPGDVVTPMDTSTPPADSGHDAGGGHDASMPDATQHHDGSTHDGTASDAARDVELKDSAHDAPHDASSDVHPASG